MTTTMTTSTDQTIKIILSERAPVTINPADWPVIASASGHDGMVECQANTERAIRVREHADGRRLVYAWEQAGDGGKPPGYRPTYGGHLVEASHGLRQPDEDGTVRAIRRVAGLIDDDKLGDECIAELPAQVI